MTTFNNQAGPRTTTPRTLEEVYQHGAPIEFDPAYRGMNASIHEGLVLTMNRPGRGRGHYRLHIWQRQGDADAYLPLASISLSELASAGKAAVDTRRAEAQERIDRRAAQLRGEA